jgi:DNA polymerase III delta prime subunit
VLPALAEVLDLGRVPEARYPGRALNLGEEPVQRCDLAAVVERLGVFGGDNRAGIERTLHRISAIRNRSGEIVGLTCRVGRAVFGTVVMVRDLLDSGQSLLLMGRPGVGKTTALREIARVLADDLEKRVVVIDTSNEIAGDGDIPHPAIGRARRMQVARPELQHQVMIEAVENHMPQVIVIDEIGTELEAQAARTIAELRLEIATNGSMTPDDAMAQAANQLIALFQPLASLTLEEEPGLEPEPSAEAQIPLEELNLSVRAYNCLKRAQVNSVSDLMGFSYEDLLEIKNFGSKSADEVIEALERIGISLPQSRTSG